MGGRQRICIALLFAALTIGFAAPCFAEDTGQEVVQTRPFSGLIRRDMAEKAAYNAALLGAWENAAHKLALLPSLQFVATVDGNGGHYIPDVFALAAMLYTPTVTLTGVQGFPPHFVAVQGITLTPPSDLQKALTTAFTNTELLQTYTHIYTLLQGYLAEYDAQAPAVLTVLPTDAGATTLASPAQHTLKKMQALEEYRQLLPHLFAPDQAPATLQKLEQLYATAPDNFLLATSTAKLLLLLDRPAEALIRVNESLAIQPDYAQSYDIKGAILLRQRLPALAVSAFSSAIALAPDYAPYKKNRAAAYLVQEEITLMCTDLYDVCAKGDCEGYKWARRTGKCQSSMYNASQVETESTPVAPRTNATQPRALVMNSTNVDNGSVNSTGTNSSRFTSAQVFPANGTAPVVTSPQPSFYTRNSTQVSPGL